MKKVLILGCVLLLVLSIGTSAANYEDMYSEAVELSTALETSDNVQELLGEAVILMIENDVLTILNEKGETQYATELKASADEALNAEASGDVDAREKAIVFCDKLIGMQKILPAEITAIKLAAESQYVSVTELEHYALTVNNGLLSNVPTNIIVEFCDEDYNSITLTNVTKFDGKDKSSFSSLSRNMVTDDNVFNFTTPKNCKFVKVSTTASGKLSVTLAVTNEVINNGSVVRVAGNSTFGWRITNNDWQNVENDYFSLNTKTTTNLKQNLILKEGSTYHLKFKYAQSCPEASTMVNTAPQLYFTALSGTLASAPIATSWEEATTLATAPADADWKEYEAYFVAKESAVDNDSLKGLLNISMYPRGYENTGGIAYYDDFSIEEIDEGSYIWYEDKNGVSVSGKSKAKTIHYHYVQNETGKTQKLIHAKYINDSLSTIELIEVGKDLAIGESRDYDIEITESESKIFLWDGKTLVPQRLPIENYVIIE